MKKKELILLKFILIRNKQMLMTIQLQKLQLKQKELQVVILKELLMKRLFFALRKLKENKSDGTINNEDLQSKY